MNYLRYNDFEMWPFKRKPKNQEAGWSNPPCPHCRSTQTRVKAQGTGENDYVKAWRGQRYITCRCLNCGQDFYIDEPHGGLPGAAIKDDQVVDDAEELKAAEDEIKRQIDEDGDRRYR